MINGGHFKGFPDSQDHLGEVQHQRLQGEGHERSRSERRTALRVLIIQLGNWNLDMKTNEFFPSKGNIFYMSGQTGKVMVMGNCTPINFLNHAQKPIIYLLHGGKELLTAGNILIVPPTKINKLKIF